MRNNKFNLVIIQLNKKNNIKIKLSNPQLILIHTKPVIVDLDTNF